MLMQQVCRCEPGGQQMSIDCCLASFGIQERLHSFGIQQQM